MNSEELEISLRTEFENYLKDVFAGMRQEISQLQTKIEAELENHKSQLDTVFKDALGRAESGVDFDAGFKDSVLEHLRLARDEGARITATAFAEAEEMDKKSASKAPGIKELHAAINDISGKESQGEILKTLVQHASQFAARGAFFIVKKEHFVAWRTFDSKNDNQEESVHEVFLPMSSDSILSEATRSLSTVESNSETYADDAPVLEKLGFGAPDKMFAIPLIARGRGVAVLYVDHGADGGDVNVEALETMVHVAGLTVEILASARGASPKKKAVSEYSEEPSQVNSSVSEPARVESGGFAPSYQVPAAEPVKNADSDYQQFSEPQNYVNENENSYAENRADKPYSDESYSNEPVYPVAPEEVERNYVSENYSDNYASEKPSESAAYEYEEVQPQTGENYPTYEDNAWNQTATSDVSPTEDTFNSEQLPQENNSNSEQFSYQTDSWNEPTENVTPVISAQEYADNFVKEADAPAQNYSFEQTVEPESQIEDSYKTNQYNFEQPPVEQPQTFAPATENYAPIASEANNSESSVANPWENSSESTAQPVAAPPVKSRLSERNVDLPIEVGEDERRLHNDARRFARLLVSEIKLYNEQKVKEGREAGDLYERLREAIDRSREMYDKRVQPPVAAKFDYFHYELVNTLAEGDGNKLGESYPGAVV